MLTGITLILIIFISILIAFYFEQFTLVLKTVKFTSFPYPTPMRTKTKDNQAVDEKKV